MIYKKYLCKFFNIYKNSNLYKNSQSLHSRSLVYISNLKNEEMKIIVIDNEGFIHFQRGAIKSRTIDTYCINRGCRHTFHKNVVSIKRRMEMSCLDLEKVVV